MVVAQIKRGISFHFLVAHGSSSTVRMVLHRVRCANVSFKRFLHGFIGSTTPTVSNVTDFQHHNRGALPASARHLRGSHARGIRQRAYFSEIMPITLPVASWLCGKLAVPGFDGIMIIKSGFRISDEQRFRTEIIRAILIIRILAKIVLVQPVGLPRIHVIMANWAILVDHGTFCQGVRTLLRPTHQVPIDFKFRNLIPISSVRLHLIGTHIGSVVFILCVGDLLGG